MFLKEFSSYVDNDTIIYNSDKLGKLPLVIYGLSGSGKTTILNNIVAKDSRYKSFSIDQIIIDHGDKHDTPITVQEILDIVKKEFIDKPNRYKILEGIQISYYTDNEENKQMRDKLQSYPTIVLGTSKLKSRYRSTFRNINSFGIWQGIFTSLVFNHQTVVDKAIKYLDELKEKSTQEKVYNIDSIILQENHNMFLR